MTGPLYRTDNRAHVLVAGGGMAGAIAALTARARGADVMLARKALGATALSSGAIDVAADPWPGSGVELGYLEAAVLLARMRPEHPYGVLRDQLSRLPEALAFATSVLGGLLSAPSGRNLRAPTALGTTKPTALVQSTQLPVAWEGLPEQIAVVHFIGCPALDGAVVARGLEATARSEGRALHAVVVESQFFVPERSVSVTPSALAERLEAPDAAELLARELAPQLPPEVGALLFPALLGRTAASPVMAQLATLLGRPCGEVLATAPSVPGLRLQAALDAALERAGVQRVEAEVQVTPGPRGSTITLSPPGEEIFPTAVVLATGRALGGGDRFGARVDEQLRPLDAHGALLAPGLYACGSLLRGYDPAADRTGLGVAVFTGFLAGERATQFRPE